MIKTELIAKRCSKCRVLKGAGDFDSRGNVCDGHQSQCRSCRLNGSRKYRAENPDKVRDTEARYYENNKEEIIARSRKWARENKDSINAKSNARRARLQGADGRYTKDDWAEILKSWDYKCAGCHCSGKLSADHIISLHMGGSNWPHNLQPLCRPCNSKKGPKSYSFIKPTI